jgi:hypothetical protein
MKKGHVIILLAISAVSFLWFGWGARTPENEPQLPSAEVRAIPMSKGRTSGPAPPLPTSSKAPLKQPASELPSEAELARIESKVQELYLSEFEKIEKAETKNIRNSIITEGDYRNHVRSILVERPFTRQRSATSMEFLDNMTRDYPSIDQSEFQNKLHDYYTFDKKFKIITISYVYDKIKQDWRSTIQVYGTEKPTITVDSAENIQSIQGSQDDYFDTESRSHKGYVARYKHLLDHYKTDDVAYLAEIARREQLANTASSKN